LDLLIERGIEETSIEQVARRAGVTRATVYRRFPDKTRLLVAAIQSGHAEVVEQPEFPTEISVEHMLAAWAQALAVPRVRRLTRRLMTSLHDHPELAEAFHAASIGPREQAIRAVLERARDRGQFPADADLDIVRTILTGAVGTHLTAHPDSSNPREIEEFLLAVLAHTCYRSRP
jgi:AcrR family transcriptional regulator